MKRVFVIGNGESRKGFDLETLRPHGKIYGCNALYRDFMPDVLIGVDHGIMHEIYHAGVAQKIPCYFRDWTKVPAMSYDGLLLGTMDKVEAQEWIKDIVVTNERGDAKEYVMHGSNISGIVTMIKKDPDKYKKDRQYLEKKNINHATIKVSWIQQPDYSTSMNDIMKPKDHGWAAGASAGWVAIHNEQPDEVYLIGHDLYSTNTKINNLYKSTKHYTTQEAGPTPAVNWITQWKTLAEWNPKITFIKINRKNDGSTNVDGPINEWRNLGNIIYDDYSRLDNLA